MSNLKSFTRGGQTLLHNVRMAEQIFYWILWLGVFSFLSISIIWILIQITAEDRNFIFTWCLASFFNIFNPNAIVNLKSHGEIYRFTASYLLNYPNAIQNAHRIFSEVDSIFFISFIISITLSCAMAISLCIKGKRFEKSKLISGRYLASKRAVTKAIKSIGKPSDIKISDVPIFKGSERNHILINGTTGMGKSEAIRQLLDQIKARGDKAVIYDKNGSFTEHYYNKEEDILLNPLDERCTPWNIWTECQDAADFDQIAASLMPMPAGGNVDPHWIDGARTVFSVSALRMRKDKNKSLKKLLAYLLTAETTQLRALLKNTEAETLVSEKIIKSTLSIKTVLATKLKMLKHIKDNKTEDLFSIRDWISDDTKNNWLFITSKSSKHETLKPLISTWIDIAVNAVMSLEENPDRRVWFILDELTSLHRLPYLMDAFAEIRKFGGCLVPGLQNYFQLQDIYGQNGAKSIVDLCNTRLFFRAPSADSSKWMSREIGQADMLEMREGVSYGANTIRDGVNISTQEVKRPAVSETEIMNLPNFNAILVVSPSIDAKKSSNEKLKDKTIKWPVCKINIACKKREIKAKGYEIAQSLSSKDSLDGLIQYFESVETSAQPENFTPSPEELVEPVQNEFEVKQESDEQMTESHDKQDDATNIKQVFEL